MRSEFLPLSQHSRSSFFTGKHFDGENTPSKLSIVSVVIPIYKRYLRLVDLKYRL